MLSSRTAAPSIGRPLGSRTTPDSSTFVDCAATIPDCIINMKTTIALKTRMRSPDGLCCQYRIVVEPRQRRDTLTQPVNRNLNRRSSMMKYPLAVVFVGVLMSAVVLAESQQTTPSV